MTKNPIIHALSDSHNGHSELILPSGDILIHCGDFCIKGTYTEAESFIKWFGKQNYKYKILVMGNHDRKAKTHPDILTLIEDYGIIRLHEDNSYIMVEGLKLWGGQFVPACKNGEYLHNSADPEVRKEAWKNMPDDLDILITHVPPKSVLDLNCSFEPIGCDFLLEAVKEKKPRVHLFGHVHESAGSLYHNKETKFYNCAVRNYQYKIIADYYEITLE